MFNYIIYYYKFEQKIWHSIFKIFIVASQRHVERLETCVSVYTVYMQTKVQINYASVSCVDVICAVNAVNISNSFSCYWWCADFLLTHTNSSEFFRTSNLQCKTNTDTNHVQQKEEKMHFFCTSSYNVDVMRRAFLVNDKI